MTAIIPAGDTTRKQKIKVILALGIPAMVENMLQTVVGFIDALRLVQ